MDLSFGRRNAIRLEALAVRPDYAQLTAMLSAAQAATPTARASARRDLGTNMAERSVDALVTVMVPASGWTSAVSSLGGSFSPDVADLSSGGGRKPT